MSTLLNDLRYALRIMGKNPGFTIICLATLALGIGANTALFSVFDAVVLRPLPFREPGRLAGVRTIDLKDRTFDGEVSYPTFLDWRAQNNSFSAMAVWNNTSFTYTGGAQPEAVPGAVVSADLFSLLGVNAALGRVFTTEEDKPSQGQSPVILSHEFWESRFNGERSVLGRALILDNDLYTVVGVMPAGFQFPVQSTRVELWTTIARDLRGKTALAGQRGVGYLQVIGRLKTGVDLTHAQSDLELIQERLDRQYPENSPRTVGMQSESEAISGNLRPALMLLLSAVGFVLLIACVNVANLLLVRATGRRKELTVRSALGASRWTIARQLLTESILLSLLGGALGLLVARWSTGILVAMAPQGLARTGEISLDLRVLGFVLLISLATGLLFGMAPATQVFGLDLIRPINDSSRTSSGGRAGVRLRAALVVLQLAISFVLLIGAGLLLRSFVHLLQVDPGFRADHVLTFLLEVPSSRHPRAQRAVFVRELLQSARSLPGVKSASAVFGLPLSNEIVFTSLDVEGRPIPPSQRPRVRFHVIESEYFRTMAIPLIHGRTFTPQDEQGGPPLAVVNETFARQIFPPEDALDRRIQANISFGGKDDAPVREIVGVVGDVKSSSIADKPALEVYVPQTPTDFIGEMTIVVRTAGDPNSLLGALRALVKSKDKDLPLRDVKTMQDYVGASVSAPRFEALLLGIFAALAFVLSAVGLYGVMSYSVAQRSREMGIRIALGAQRASILGMVVREGALLAGMGSGAGLAASFFATRILRAFLFGIGVTDPLTFLGVPILLVGVALMASYVPARRAMLVDPMLILREE